MATDHAPYTLVQVDTTTATTPTPLTITWHNLSVTDGSPVPTQPTTPTTPKPNGDANHAATLVLDAVSGDALAGEILAIVGPSSKATTALLDAIAQNATALPTMTGCVRINGHVLPRLTPTLAAYAPRRDALCPTNTIAEHLHLQSRLRLHDETTTEDHTARVADVMAVMGLTDQANTRVGHGTPESMGLSPRDRKLLGIATELLPHPPIVLVSEPTADLAAVDAEIVVRRLQTLAQRGHTVVLSATLDQLNSAMFQLVDKIHLLSNSSPEAPSRTVFHGKPIDSLAFFQTNGEPCPPLTSPFEFFTRQLAVCDPADSVRVHRLTSAWEGAALSQTLKLATVEPSSVVPQATVVVTPMATQLNVLLRRSLLRLSRDVATLRMRVARAIALALIVGLIFLRLDVSQTTVQSFSSACFFIVASQFVTNTLPELSIMPAEVVVVLRDHRNGLYHALNWYLVKNLSEIPFQLFFPLLFLVPAYFLVGFPADAEIFFTFYLFVFLVVSAGAAIALFASSIAPKPALAFVIGLVFLAPSIIFGGPFVNRQTTPDYFLWLQQMLPVKYGYHGLLRGFWTHVDAIYCPPNTLCRATSGESVLQTNFIHVDAFASDVQILVAINLTLRVLGGLALWRRAAVASARK